MSDTITINEKSAAKMEGGINKHDLLQTVSDDVKGKYEEFLLNAEGSLSTASDNDTSQKIRVARVLLNPTDDQSNMLNLIEKAFVEIETKIDPNRLRFTVTKAMDDEICINRTSESGLAKIIINDDGMTFLSYISFPGEGKKDVFEPCSDVEGIAYKFFSF